MHLTAIAGRVGVKIDLHRLNEVSDSTPVLVDLKPTGQFYMPDLYAAGGVGGQLAWTLVKAKQPQPKLFQLRRLWQPLTMATTKRLSW